MGRASVRNFVSVLFVSTLVALAVRLFLVEDYRIASNSMSPNLLTGDLIFVSKFNYNLHLPFSTYEIFRFSRPRPSEIVTFTLPDRGMETFVKRVGALEGDEVSIQKGILTINGKPAKYSSIQGEGTPMREELAPGESYQIQAEPGG